MATLHFWWNMPRSILTEKVARRGFHVSREYAVDPLEALFVRDVMTTNLLTAKPDQTIDELVALADGTRHRRQRLYPVLDPAGRLLGVIGRSEVASAAAAGAGDRGAAASIMRPPVVAHPDETLRAAAERMAATRLGVLPVVDRADAARLRGLVSQFDLLRARDRLLAEERHREQVLRLRALPSFRGRPAGRT